MADKDFDAGRHIDAVAPTMGLTITDAQRPGVETFLNLVRDFAQEMEKAPVPDDSFHLASVFRPGKRGA